VAKPIALAIGVGVILLNIENGLGFASYYAKPLIFIGVVSVGIQFALCSIVFAIVIFAGLLFTGELFYTKH
jgi:hypothetical protein